VRGAHSCPTDRCRRPLTEAPGARLHGRSPRTPPSDSRNHTEVRLETGASEDAADRGWHWAQGPVPRRVFGRFGGRSGGGRRLPRGAARRRRIVLGEVCGAREDTVGASVGDRPRVRAPPPIAKAADAPPARPAIVRAERRRRPSPSDAPPPRPPVRGRAPALVALRLWSRLQARLPATVVASGQLRRFPPTAGGRARNQAHPAKRLRRVWMWRLAATQTSESVTISSGG
jgi:hypothetical protein